MLNNVDMSSIISNKETNYEGNSDLKCPYQNILNNFIENKADKKENLSINEIKKDILTDTEISTISKCPYKHGPINKYPNLDEINNSTIIEDENAVSSCPMINKIRKVREEIFSFFFEIPYETPYDYIFNCRGNISNKQFLEKTSKLRSMPRHLRFTLLHLTEDKLIQLRKKEFPYIYFTYEELREKAYNFYKKEEYKQAIKYYNFTYSIFKWLEFKDASRKKDLLHGKDVLPILDEDIEENRINTEIEANNYEEDCYKACLVTLLKHMSLCYMHLRHFSEAITCLNEAISYSCDKVPELFLRRSQARTYSKNSNKDQLEIALKDISRAIKLNPEEPRFQIHLKVLTDLIEQNNRKEAERTEKLIQNAKYSFLKINHKKLNLNNYVYSSYDHIDTNSKVLDEMLEKYKNTLKFHNENNDQKQIAVSCREIEEFSEVYYKFKWYYLFDVKNLPEKLEKSLALEDRYFSFFIINLF